MMDWEAKITRDPLFRDKPELQCHSHVKLQYKINAYIDSAFFKKRRQVGFEYAAALKIYLNK